MKISINEEQRCARVGLDGTEIDNPNVWRGLQPMINQFKQMDYLFVIYESDKAGRE